jgi:hypothetical protein
LLKTRLLVSSTYGTKVLNNEDQLSTIFDHWKNHLNVEYVMVTEDLINDGNHNFHSIFSIYIQKNCQMTEFRTAHCDLTEKIKFSIFYFTGMTRHQRDDDLSYGRRTFESHSLRPAFVPYHLYGQLSSSKQGMEILIRHPDIHDILAQLANAEQIDK